MARVVIENLTKVFPRRGGESIRAVDNASLTVQDRELLVLVGPSGCGKTTTLRLIAGLEQATQGTISIDGKIMNGIPPKHRDVAMVFQNYALYPHMTVYENMAFGLKLRKYSKAETEKRVLEAAELLGLTTFLHARPDALSGGERQRVALGRGLVRQPKLLLLDEPLSNLDPRLRLQMRAEISRLHSGLGSAMIYVTHDQVEAMTMGDRIAVMNQGVFQQVAEPMTLYEQPANMFVAGFIGSPPMNFFNGTLLQKDNALFFEEQHRNGAPANPITLRLNKGMTPQLRPYLGKEVVFGIRPENIALQPDGGIVGPQQKVEALTEVIQCLGSETHLCLNSGAHSFIVRLPATNTVAPNQMLALKFEMSRAHFFDPASQKRIA
jgi:multiple sugar transport system ATP-binding protein